MNRLITIAVLVVGLYTIVEIWALLALGGVLGVGWTMAWMLGSMVAGVVLLRIEGLSALVRIHRELQAERVPTRELLHMFLILLGGFLLIAPGFLSDFLGICLLLPPVRWLATYPLLTALRGALPDGVVQTAPPPPGDVVIEIDPDREP